MSNIKKITKAQKFAMLMEIPEVASNPMLVEFIEHELELLAKKNSAERKPTSRQTENLGIQDAILEVMASEPNRLFTITEIIKSVPVCAELTNQRVSAIIRSMIGVSVERVEDKRKAYFRFIGD